MRNELKSRQTAPAQQPVHSYRFHDHAALDAQRGVTHSCIDVEGTLDRETG